MKLNEQIASHVRGVHFGGNWTDVNLKDTVANISWQQATSKIGTLNTIAALVFHMNYYISAILEVLKGGALDAKDKYSFDLPPIQSQEEWEQLIKKALDDAENFATLVEKLPDSKFGDIFTDEKYGNFYRNIHGVIEHTHYHLGQIVIMKKKLA
jgi:uncharacterized damage-inducible protein DinB